MGVAWPRVFKGQGKRLVRTGRYFGTGRWNMCPRGRAALSRSTSVKPPALPEVADLVPKTFGLRRLRLPG
jgi:hypothetical protein